MEKKSRILYTLKYLHEHSDAQHPVSGTEIMAYLQTQGFSPHRVTLIRDIAKISEIGFEVITVRSSPNKHYLNERVLEPHELKMLVDAVSSSKFITQKKSEALINKLSALTSASIAKTLRRGVCIDRIVKPANEKIYYTIDAIQAAIETKGWVSFQYYAYNVDKQLVYRHDGYVYEVCPYATFWRDDHYYLLGFSRKHNKIATYRIDRMDAARQYEDTWLPPPDDFDPSIYANKVFEMFDGQLTTVELKCKNALMDAIVDKFGEDVDVYPLGSNHFKVITQLHVSPRFYGWVFGFAGGVYILGPAEVKNTYIEMAQDVLDKHI